ncbi:hypothetical protein BGW80DRAFT_1458691 [Lactifluus volemus]|nr:hypothetical protein BGW80DRAFT_1458691 [Lactifluus volemus]
MLRAVCRPPLRSPFPPRRLITLSAVEGARDPPLDNRTLPDYFSAEILSPRPERAALICSHERPRVHGGPLSRNMGVDGHLAWDFSEFDRHISALARGLVGLGVKKGDRVGVVMGNTSAYAMLQWACARIGAILVTINPAYRIQELIETTRLVGISHLFLVPQIRTSSYLTLLAEALRHYGKVHEMLGEIHSAVDFREVLLWQEAGTKEDRLVEEARKTLDKDDVINLQFTRSSRFIKPDDPRILSSS